MERGGEGLGVKRRGFERKLEDRLEQREKRRGEERRGEVNFYWHQIIVFFDTLLTSPRLS